MNSQKTSSFLTGLIGLTVSIAISYGASYVLFALSILYLGVKVGIIISWIISFIVFYLMILFYSWTKRDWIGIEKIKTNLKKTDSKNFFTKLLIYANKKGEKLFFIVLSIKMGPFTSLLYMRDANDYSKMQRKDWKIFLVAYLITNGFTTLVVLSGLLLNAKK